MREIEDEGSWVGDGGSGIEDGTDSTNEIYWLSITATAQENPNVEQVPQSASVK